MKGDRFDGAIAGSGDLSVESIDVSELTGHCRSGQCQLGTGRVKNAQYEIAGSGGIDAKGVAAERAAVSITGAGNVAANAAKTAAVEHRGLGRRGHDGWCQVHDLQDWIGQRPLQLRPGATRKINHECGKMPA